MATSFRHVGHPPGRRWCGPGSRRHCLSLNRCCCTGWGRPAPRCSAARPSSGQRPQSSWVPPQALDTSRSNSRNRSGAVSRHVHRIRPGPGRRAPPPVATAWPSLSLSLSLSLSRSLSLALARSAGRCGRRLRARPRVGQLPPTGGGRSRAPAARWPGGRAPALLTSDAWIVPSGARRGRPPGRDRRGPAAAASRTAWSPCRPGGDVGAKQAAVTVSTGRHRVDVRAQRRGRGAGDHLLHPVGRVGVVSGAERAMQAADRLLRERCSSTIADSRRVKVKPAHHVVLHAAEGGLGIDGHLGVAAVPPAQPGGLIEVGGPAQQPPCSPARRPPRRVSAPAAISADSVTRYAATCSACRRGCPARWSPGRQ